MPPRGESLPLYGAAAEDLDAQDDDRSPFREDDDVEAGRVRVALERSRGADVRQEREERLDGARAPGRIRVLRNAVTSVNRLG